MSINAIIPNPFSSLEQYERYWHLDLTQLEDDNLTDELHALRPLLWGLPDDHWLRTRVRMLEAEMVKRKINISQEFRVQPKPKLAKGVTL